MSSSEVVALGLGPGLYVPLVADERRLGTLVLARLQGKPAYQALDIAFAEVFASSTAAAIEIGEIRDEVDRLGIVAEDERIARDLHDTVIQQLFALGMFCAFWRSACCSIRQTRRTNLTRQSTVSTVSSKRSAATRSFACKAAPNKQRDFVTRCCALQTNTVRRTRICTGSSCG